MEIRVLRYFLAVVREEGINRAAEVLHITQPTLSRQLSQLEDEVGVKLFHRGAKKITLTNEGILLRRRAEGILALVDRTEQEFACFVVGFVGEAAVSGVSLVNSFNTIFLNLFVALASGGAVVISQYIGRKEKVRAGEAAQKLSDRINPERLTET